MYQPLKKEAPKQQAIQKKDAKKPNYSGIPDTLKTKYENHSGFSFDDVRVHYNSDKPAQFQALAYTQGNQVYMAPRQERHLEHELGHVVQQKQGIVKPTGYRNNIPINIDMNLENAADQVIVNSPESFENRGNISLIQRKKVDCIQFTKDEVFKRIKAFLNLDNYNTDRESILYKALCSVTTQTRALQITSAENSLEKIEELLTEEEVIKVETEFIEQIKEVNENKESKKNNINEEIRKRYGKYEKENLSAIFSDDFISHHFAKDFKEAFEISKSRFVPKNTVLIGFQQDMFSTREFISLSQKKANNEFTTNSDYYYWQFKKEEVNLYSKGTDVPDTSELLKVFKSKVKVKANINGKVFHLEGTSGIQIALPKDNSKDAKSNMFCISRELGNVSEEIDNSILARIHSYLQCIVGELNKDSNSENKVIGVYLMVLSNFFEVLSTLKDIEKLKNTTSDTFYAIVNIEEYFNNKVIETFCSLRGFEKLYKQVYQLYKKISEIYNPKEEAEEEEEEI